MFVKPGPPPALSQRLERDITVPLRKRVCGCHRYLLHRLGGLGPELAELAWSGPLCTQLQHTRQERHRSERAGGREKEGGEREQRETTEEDSSEKHRFYDFFLGTEYDLTGRALSVNKQDYKEIQRADWLFGKGGEIVRSSLVRIAQQMKSNWEKHNNMPPKPRGQSIRRRVLTGKLSKQMSANAYK